MSSSRRGSAARTEAEAAAAKPDARVELIKADLFDVASRHRHAWDEASA